MSKVTDSDIESDSSDIENLQCCNNPSKLYSILLNLLLLRTMKIVKLMEMLNNNHPAIVE